MSEVRVDFKSDSSQVDKSVSKVKSGIGTIGTAAKGLGATLKSAFLPLFAIGAALGGITAVVGGFKDVIDLGGDIDDLSVSTGVAADQLIVLGTAFEMAGISGDLVGKAILGLNNKLEAPTPKIIETLNQLGINLENIQGMSMSEKFSTISKSIGRLSNETDRAAASSVLFGGALGRGLLPLFAGGGAAIEDATKNVGGLADTLLNYAPAFAKIGDAFDSVIIKSRQLFAAILGENADKLVSIADSFMAIDLTKAGQAMGKMLADVVQIGKVIIESFGAGTLGVTFGNALELGWLNFKPILLTGLEMAANIFSTALIEGMTASFAFLGQLDIVKNLKVLQTALNVKAKMDAGAKEGTSGLSPEEMARKAELEKGFKLNLEPILGPKLPTAEETARAIKRESGPLNVSSVIDTAKGMAAKLSENAAKLKATKGGSLMETLFGSKDFGTTSLQRIGGASGLTGNTLTETRETNNILRRIEQLLGKPTPNTGSSNQYSTFAL